MVGAHLFTDFANTPSFYCGSCSLLFTIICDWGLGSSLSEDKYGLITLDENDIEALKDELLSRRSNTPEIEEALNELYQVENDLAVSKEKNGIGYARYYVF